jgi:predicted dehydrogenase
MIGLGIVGLGRWATAHAAAAVRSDEVEFVNCFARSESSRQAFKDAHGIGSSASSVEELVSDPRVRAVVVSSPNDVHASQIKTVVEAGKPVLVDKPMAVDVSEGLDVLRLASLAPVGVAHHARRLAGHRAAKAWVESGGGQVRTAHGDFSNSRGGSMKPDAWHRSVRGSEAGVLIQVGIHQVDTLLYLLGPVRSVNARFAYGALGREIPDAALVTMEHVSGAMSTVSSSWTTPSHYRTDLLATGGNLMFTLDHGHWSSGDVDDFGALVLDTGDGEPAAYPIDKGDPLRDQLEELGLAAADGTPMTVDAMAGLRAIAVVEAAVLSAARRGAPVEMEHLLRRAGGTVEEVETFLNG